MVLVRAFRLEVHILYVSSLLASALVLHCLVQCARDERHGLRLGPMAFLATVHGLFFSPLRLARSLRARALRVVAPARMLVGVWLLFDLVMNTAYLAAEKSARAAPAYSQVHAECRV